MKKKPTYKAEKIMIAVAIALIVIAVIGVLYVVLNEAGVFNGADEADTTAAPETTIPVAVIEHEDIETETNSDGTPKKVTYYKDNVYDGSIDYVYEGDTIYEVHFDADDNLLKSIKKRINDIGNIVYESYSSAKELLREVEYTYYDDHDTLWKKQTTEHENGKRIATKELYSEDGLLTEKFVYEDSVEVSHIVYTYDENGEIAEEKEIG